MADEEITFDEIVGTGSPTPTGNEVFPGKQNDVTVKWSLADMKAVLGVIIASLPEAVALETNTRLLTPYLLGQVLSEYGLADNIIAPDSAARLMTGGVTSTGFTAAFDVASDVTTAGIRYSTNSNMSGATTTTLAAPTARDGVRATYRSVKVAVTGLSPNTLYYWQPVFNTGPKTEVTAQVWTFQTAGTASSFSVVIGSCSEEFDSRNPSYTFRAMNEESDVRLVWHFGDFGYPDVSSPDVKVMRDRETRPMRNSPDLIPLLLEQPIHVGLADHDLYDDVRYDTTFSSGATGAILAANARQVRGEEIPQYTLPLAGTLLQSWSMGRVLCVSPDLYSQPILYQTTLGTGTVPNTGADQRTALFDLLAAVNPSTHKLVLLETTRAWIGLLGDAWTPRWSVEQQLLAEVIADMDVMVVLIGGDPHASGIGVNGDYTQGSRSRFLYFCSSPLDHSPGSGDQGPYLWEGDDTTDHQVKDNRFQYGVVSVADSGGTNLVVTATAKGAPIDDETFAATTYMTLATDTVANVVDFDLPAGAAEVIVSEGSGIPIRKSGLGPIDGCSVAWTFDPDDPGDDVTGTATFKPNLSRQRFTGAWAGDGNLTFGSPTRCTIAGGITSPMPLRFISGLEAETCNYVNAMDVIPADANIGAIDDFIAFLKTDLGDGTWWSLFDFVNLLCLEELQQGQVNIVNPRGRWDLVPQGTMILTPGVGTRSSGDGSVFLNGYHGRDGVRLQRYSGSIGIDTPTDANITQGGMIGNPEWFINPRGDGGLRGRYGNNATVVFGLEGDSTGLSTVNRTSQSTLAGYREGVMVGSAVSQSTDNDPSTAEFYVCGWNSNSNSDARHYPARDLAFCWAGAPLPTPTTYLAAMRTALDDLYGDLVV